MRRDFMALGAQHEQAAGLQGLVLEASDLGADFLGPPGALGLVGHVGELLADAHIGIAAELDVGAAAGHVGGDRNGARNPRLGDDIGLLFVIARVEDREHFYLRGPLIAGIKRREGVGISEVVLLPALLAQHLGKLLGFFDRRGADQNGLPAFLALLDQRDDGAVFFDRGAIDLVVIVEAGERHVGGDFQHLEIINVEKLVGLGQRRSGHAGELLVHAEIVLERDRGECLVFRLNLLMLLRFQRLVQAFGIAPARHHPAGEFVDDDDFTVAHDVILVALEQLVGAQGLIDVMHGGDVFHVIERIGFQEAGRLEPHLHLFHPGFGEVDGALLLVEIVIALVEIGNERIDGVVKIRTVVKRTGNDQRRARFVDQDRVHLIDDRIDVAALDHVLQPVFHIVA